MPLFDHFDLLAPFYDRVIGVNQVNDLITRLALPEQGRLLDAGGGTGRISQLFRSHASEIVVADLSLPMLRQALAGKGLDAVCAQTEYLPFRTAYFDRVIMVDALHHVIDHQSTAHELWRVLTPGGKIIIEEMDVRQAPVKLVALAEKMALMRSHFINPTRIAALFQHPLAAVETYISGHTAWIIVNKPA